MTTNYVAIVVGDDLIDREITPEETRPLAVGGDGVVVLHGDLEAVSVLVAATDEDDAARRIAATFGDAATIDDMGESIDQLPYAISDCGCVAWGDGTGSPCALHLPDGAAS